MIEELQKQAQIILLLFSVSLIQNHLYLQTSASLSPPFQKLLLPSLEVVPILTKLKGIRNQIPLATMLLCQTLWMAEEEDDSALSHFYRYPKEQNFCSV